MPAFFATSVCAASCQVRPTAPSWWKGRISVQWSKTLRTLASVQEALPAISSTWKS
jgi:hypothetical protein